MGWDIKKEWMMTQVTERNRKGMSWDEHEEKVMLAWTWWDPVKETSGKPKESKAICGTLLSWTEYWKVWWIGVGVLACLFHVWCFDTVPISLALVLILINMI